MTNKVRLGFQFINMDFTTQDSSPRIYWLYIPLAIFVFLFVIWICISKYDNVVIGDGITSVNSSTYSVFARNSGFVKQLNVKPGEEVKEGDLVLNVSPLGIDLNREQVGRQITHLRQNLLREEILTKLFWIEQQSEGLSIDRVEMLFSNYLSQVALEQRVELTKEFEALLWPTVKQQWQDYDLNNQVVRNQLSSKLSEIHVIELNIEKYNNTLPLIEKQIALFESDLTQGSESEREYFKLQEKRVTQQQDYLAERAKLEQLNAQVSELEQTLDVKQNAARKRNYEDIAQLKRDIVAVEQRAQLESERELGVDYFTKSNGILKNVFVAGNGDFVQQGDKLYELEPSREFMEVHTRIKSNEVRYVKVGQSAKVAVKGYPENLYGNIIAYVTDILPISDKRTPRAEYLVKLKLKSTQLNKHDRMVNLIPGMHVSSTIMSGEIRILDIFLGRVD